MAQSPHRRNNCQGKYIIPSAPHALALPPPLSPSTTRIPQRRPSPAPLPCTQALLDLDREPSSLDQSLRLTAVVGQWRRGDPVYMHCYSCPTAYGELSGLQCDTGFNLPKKENGSCGGQYNLASKKGDLPTPTIQVVLPFSAVTEDEFQKQLTQDSGNLSFPKEKQMEALVARLKGQ
ncbi:hypothetical protein OsJ_11575 [Oryza sativa Japonica Group]|uniref:Uncharacterized protein n=2 Tax=Oryza TaxID=4527 RepID=A3AJZ2_ORYSJ|nr:hypothetical protein OsJ_11575 [Oryza sativa Japonica Group]